MYDNGSKDNFLRDLIVKILLILLFIFLLMWLFPIPNLTTFYDKVFTQNMNEMTKVAKTYFTVSKLPQNEGETKTITLKEMIKNKMIIEFTDSDGNTCDSDKSYVEVTKKDGEYIFKTNLVCSNVSDYVIEYFGCYDVCVDESCKTVETVIGEPKQEEPKKPTPVKPEPKKEEPKQEEPKKEEPKQEEPKKEEPKQEEPKQEEPKQEEPKQEEPVIVKKIEYKFYKIIVNKFIDKYVCADGYQLSGLKCIKKSVNTKEQMAQIVCPNGYVYNSNINKCEKEVTEEIEASKECPKGYVYSTTNNKCIMNNNSVVDANKTVTCPSGYTLNSNKTKCVKEEAAKFNYYCNTGVLNGSKCIIEDKTLQSENCASAGGTLVNGKCEIKENAIVSGYKCDNGGTLTGQKCIISESVKYTYNCNGIGGTLSGDKCVTSSTYTTPKNCEKVQTCSYVYSSTGGSGCSKTIYADRYSCKVCSYTYTNCSGGETKTDYSSKAANSVATCNSGYTLSADKKHCEKTYDATAIYKCSDGSTPNGKTCTIYKSSDKNVFCNAGYKLNDSKTKCIKEDTAKINYYCDNGTLDSNNKCVSNREIIVQYNCSTGKLDGTKCVLNNTISTNYSYSCSVGVLNGSKCVVYLSDKKDVSYKCNAGYKLIGNRCYNETEIVDTKDASPVYNTKTETIYKWSSSTSLDGWLKTGETREVVA